jgi:hypothetical protein
MRGVVYKRRVVPADQANQDTQKKNIRKKGNGKMVHCSVCGNETFQKDGICVVCVTNVSRLYKELQDLLAENTKCRIRHFRKFSFRNN